MSNREHRSEHGGGDLCEHRNDPLTCQACKDEQKMEQLKLSREEVLAWDPDKKMTPEFAEKFARVLVDVFREKGLEEHMGPSFDNVYRRYFNELIVRRENPARLVKAIATDEPLEIICSRPDFQRDESEKYINSARWKRTDSSEATIGWAIEEGFGNRAGGIFVVEAFRPDLDGVTIHEDVKPSIKQLRQKDGTMRTREWFRSVEGEIQKDDMEFILVGIPIDLFPQEHMTEDEKIDLEVFQEELQEFKDGDRKQRPFRKKITRMYTQPQVA